MNMAVRSYFLVACYLFVSLDSFSAAPKPMKENKSHVSKWNKFANDVFKLHEILIKDKEIETKVRIGGYSNFPKFYKETIYTDKKSGKVISIIQMEVKKPKNLHVAEVYVRDAKGRVIRDFSVTYLPYGRNAPVQTLINLHGYSGKMHGFRQFDVSGDLIYEHCLGEYKGKKYQIRLFEDLLFSGSAEVDKTMAGGAYKACFKSVAKSAKKYISKPH